MVVCIERGTWKPLIHGNHGCELILHDFVLGSKKRQFITFTGTKSVELDAICVRNCTFCLCYIKSLKFREPSCIPLLFRRLVLSRKASI